MPPSDTRAVSLGVKLEIKEEEDVKLYIKEEEEDVKVDVKQEDVKPSPSILLRHAPARHRSMAPEQEDRKPGLSVQERQVKRPRPQVEMSRAPSPEERKPLTGAEEAHRAQQEYHARLTMAQESMEKVDTMMKGRKRVSSELLCPETKLTFCSADCHRQSRARLFKSSSQLRRLAHSSSSLSLLPTSADFAPPLYFLTHYPPLASHYNITPSTSSHQHFL